VFEISFPSSARQEALTGRVVLVVSRTDEPGTLAQAGGPDSQPIFAVSAEHLRPGKAVIVDNTTLGYPVQSLREIPVGNYYIQAYALVYTRYPRADGHVIWALDQWDGHEGPQSPGSLRSKVQKIHFDPSENPRIKLSLTEVVPPTPLPVDTEWVKHIKVKSELLSKFWGHPIYLGADVILPRGYSSHPERRYPVIYDPRNHYLRVPAFDFTSNNVPEKDQERSKREELGYETGYEFFRKWSGERFPRMITVTLINPTPYYDFSAVMNSVNNGPYDDALMSELIPYIEGHFRIIREPYARVLVGKSSGGRDALGLQMHHPDFFGGAWIFYPWPFNYRYYCNFNIYEADNAYVVGWTETAGMRDQNSWTSLDRLLVRTTDGKPVYTLRQWILPELVIGGRSGVHAEISGSDDALNGPIAEDGYPKPLYDKLTGKIDHQVAEYWRQHDLAYYAQANWSKIGPLLVGKLHLYAGDMDEWHRNFGVHNFQQFLETTQNPYYAGSFVYGSLKGHGWQPMTNAELVQMVAEYVAKGAPKGASVAWKSE